MTAQQTPGAPAPAAAVGGPAATPATPSPHGVAGAHTPAGTSPPAGPTAGGLPSEGSPPALTVLAYGDPAGQGAIRYGKTGRGYHANAKQLKPWRRTVRRAALDAADRHEYIENSVRKACLWCDIVERKHAMILGAVRLDIEIVVPALKAPKAYPITRSSSDWDHYARAIGDALAGVVYVDDSQIVEGRCRKTYPGTVLNRPGALIRIWEVW